VNGRKPHRRTIGLQTTWVLACLVLSTASHAATRVKAGDLVEVCWRATDTTRPLASRRDFVCTGSVKAGGKRSRGEITSALLLGFTRQQVPDYAGGRIWVRAVPVGGDPSEPDTPTVWVPPHSDELFNAYVVKRAKNALRIYLDIDLPMRTQ
jgi:hypothetical protein